MIKDTISYDEFQKIDIRVGEIVKAEIVPDTDKLLRLMVDFGLQQSAKPDSSPEHFDGDQNVLGEEREIRQIISGIRESVESVEGLVGKKTTFIVNLEPRTICGLESQGMLFAVGGDSAFSFLVPEGDVEAGSPLV